MRAEDIIIKPILTEKGYDGIASKKYTFKVAKSANKTQIKIAIEQLFGVKVASVNTMNVRGKLKRMGRNEGMTPSYKKAIVQLTEDSKAIEYFNSLS
ncbi:MAG TPA: 50S ribosomal protein L23 [Candidatus Borkfalkia excrementigallinarum]|uniref:Large ribosomal subunit protein uL23 n=1 Tax=Candidatus Borkfalkia excrementigallinarum TaxID=2838506 RepID=A0A9D1ZVB6_9FIRM|nr:50S ribosomal protein L23 [Candidatus Borkfalkia excrementigallinarum]